MLPQGVGIMALGSMGGGGPLSDVSSVISGRVVRTQSGFFWVDTAQGEIVARARGKLLEARLDTDPVALGDIVHLRIESPGKGLIESVEPRRRAFSRQRPAPEGRRAEKMPDREKVIIANPDQVVFVFACASPEPNTRTLDRYLVIAESRKIPVLICANKVDLVGKRAAKDIFDIYDAIGYPVIYTSTVTPLGIEQLREALQGKVSALTGPSGVGKSSLLNALQPGLGQSVGEVSRANFKGRHTTVSAQMFPLDGGGWLADTPGIRSIGLYNIEPSELDGYFPEIYEFIRKCKFRDCRHISDEGCAVRAALERDDIWEERYISYLRMREECEAIYYRC